MKPAAVYGIGRLVFGIAALAVPGTSGPVLAGEGGGAPDAQAFLRGMGGREIGLGLGLLGSHSGESFGGAVARRRRARGLQRHRGDRGRLVAHAAGQTVAGGGNGGRHGGGWGGTARKKVAAS